MGLCKVSLHVTYPLHMSLYRSVLAVIYKVRQHSCMYLSF